MSHKTSLNHSWYFYRIISDKFDIEEIDNTDLMDISQWTDLAKIVCDGIEDGPPSRSLPKDTNRKDILLDIDVVESSDTVLQNELDVDEVRR